MDLVYLLLKMEYVIIMILSKHNNLLFTSLSNSSFNKSSFESFYITATVKLLWFGLYPQESDNDFNKFDK